jgi:hypothetical protein
VISEIKNDEESGVVLGSVMRRFSVKNVNPWHRNKCGYI